MKKMAVSLLLAQAAAVALAQAAAPAGAAARFVCGGISQPESESMKAQAREHDAMLTFAERTGAYLADVDVQITDRRGAIVLEAKCEGPIMLLDLPGAGSWRVKATANGQTRQQTLTTAKGKTARATFVWPAGNP